MKAYLEWEQQSNYSFVMTGGEKKIRIKTKVYMSELYVPQGTSLT